MAEIQPEAIFHPVRMRIITALHGRQRTTGQLASALPDVPQATLYRHLKRLLNAGLVSVADQRPVRGVLEKVYALSESAVVSPESVARMTPDDWRRAFAAYTASLMGQFEVYLQSEPADLVADGVSFRTAPLYLSDTEAAQLLSDLRALIAATGANGPAPDRRRRLLSTVLVPEIKSDEIGDSE